MSEQSRYRMVRSAEQQRSARGTFAFEGEPHGSGVSMFIIDYDQVGEGPNLHKHPYPETWILWGGTARFTVGEETIEANSGDVVVCAGDTPHMFKNAGPGNLSIICIHPSPRFIQEDLA
jgi:mannose-6-phosphate isomerase-like protein (cupin superfamily)